MKINKIMLIIACHMSMATGCIFADVYYGKDALILDLNLVKAEADVVLTGQASPAPRPYWDLGKKFYHIIPDGMIDGKLATNSFLVVPFIHSSAGRPVKPEEKMRYMFFLRAVDLSADGLPSEMTAYYLVDNWKGAIALDKMAKDQRAVNNLEKQYGVRVNENPQDFIDAIRMSVGTDTATNASTNAKNLCRTLKLKRSKTKTANPAPNTSGRETQHSAEPHITPADTNVLPDDALTSSNPLPAVVETDVDSSTGSLSGKPLSQPWKPILSGIVIASLATLLLLRMRK